MLRKATVFVQDGDLDCSEAVRRVGRAVGVLPYGSYMWTGNEVELLTANGFVERDLSSPQPGDVLWREGHTEMYLFGGMQGGARHDEQGGLTGPRAGDQTGTEVARSAYNESEWRKEGGKLLRYEGGGDIEGIPIGIAMALVMDAMIDDPAFGYSQPNRRGNGSVKAITITYDPDTEAIPMRKTVIFKKATSVRTRPSADEGAKTGTIYKVGEPCNIDGIVFADGRVWGTYVGAKSGERRYVCLGTTERAEVA